jgi:hypothetical protein
MKNQMAHREHDLLDAGPFHLPEQHFQNRHIPNGHQWFRQDAGIRRQPGTLTPCQYNSFHSSLPLTSYVTPPAKFIAVRMLSDIIED